MAMAWGTLGRAEEAPTEPETTPMVEAAEAVEAVEVEEAIPDAPAPVAHARADDWEPQARVRYSNLLALRYNPLGLIERVQFSYRHRLFQNDHALFRGAWVDLGAEVSLAPTYLSGGPRLEIRPLSILGFSVTYEAIGYFGVLDAVMPMESTQQSYWETELSARGQQGDNQSGTGSRLTLSGLLQGKVGPVILRTQVSALRVELPLGGGATMMYDATQDLVLPNGGWAILNDLDFGAQIKKVLVGARYSYADALHGTGGPGDLATHRVGPIFAYTFHNRPSGARFDEPTLLLLVQWHAQHPFRAGQERHVGIPLIALAFQFQGDLWTGKR